MHLFPRFYQIFQFFNQVDRLFICYPKLDDYKYTYHDEIDRLCSSIKEELDLSDDHNSKWIFYNPTFAMKRDLSKNANNFLCIYLFHELLQYFPRDDRAKQQFKQPSKMHYESKISMNFTSCDISLLVCMIEDLNTQHEQPQCLVYQSMKLSRNELKKFSEYQGKLLLYKGVLFASQMYPQKRTNVLLKIESNVNYSNERQDTLFDFNTTFKIKDGQQLY
ncbi:unnamed protein product [Adineta ricciae]|uniref:Uncharacterized protein n=1 Tax=Adineta ricciae TaxID=249248 RepID=A0A815XX07_ADIRI|nr:unnamed protein product [Adineta ricciae]CAF1562822.1 unnamed protein product [Adineta ricciae]